MGIKCSASDVVARVRLPGLASTSCHLGMARGPCIGSFRSARPNSGKATIPRLASYLRVPRDGALLLIDSSLTAASAFSTRSRPTSVFHFT